MFQISLRRTFYSHFKESFSGEYHSGFCKNSAFFYRIRKKECQTKQQKKEKLNKLSNDRNIKLINGNRSFINNGENLRNQRETFCSNLPSRILLAPSSYIDIESRNIISSDALKISKELKEDGKSKFIDTKNE